MKNKQRTSTKVIISYNDGSTYTFTNVQQFSLMPKYDEIEVTQIRNKDKFIREDLTTYTKLTHVKEFKYLPKEGNDTTYKVVNGMVVEKTIKEKLEPSPRFTLDRGIIKNHPAIRNIRVTRGL